MKRSRFVTQTHASTRFLLWLLLVYYTFLFAISPKLDRLVIVAVDRNRPLSNWRIRGENLSDVSSYMIIPRPEHYNTSGDAGIWPSKVLPKPSTKVLLVAYYRSGSSFLGQILAQHPASFYWFEPLQGEGPKTNRNVLRKNNGTTMVETRFDVLENNSLATDILAHVLTCRATELSRRTLSGRFLNSTFGKPRLAPYVACLRQTRHDKYRTCSRILEDTCLNSSIVVAKVIRYPMHEMRHLELAVPDLKVIHYVRDPRGIAVSRARLLGWSTSTMTTDLRRLCAKMAHDVGIFRDLRRLRPRNHLQLRYEDLALRTEQTAKRIYRFVDLELPPGVLSWIETHTRVECSGPYGTCRNATDAAHKWRSSLNGSVLDRATRTCRSVLDAFQYQH